MRRAIAIAAVAGMLSACVREERIALDHTPQVGVAIVPGADRVSLDVVSQDKRPQFQDRVGTGRGSSKVIIADNDVVDLVRGAVARELQDQGFVLAAGGLIVTVELQNFYCDYSYNPVANVAFTLRVRSGAGLTLYTRYYEGTGRASRGILPSIDNAKVALEQAIGLAVKQVDEDKSLQAALLSAKSKAAVTSAAPRT